MDTVVARIEQEEAAAEVARRARQVQSQAEIQHFLAQQQELKKRWVRGTLGCVGVTGPSPCLDAAALLHYLSSSPCCFPSSYLSCRQREAQAAEERSIQEYLRKRREREAAAAARQANKREAQDRCGTGTAELERHWLCCCCSAEFRAHAYLSPNHSLISIQPTHPPPTLLPRPSTTPPQGLRAAQGAAGGGSGSKGGGGGAAGPAAC